MYQELLKVVCFSVLEMNSLGLHSNLVAQAPFYDEKSEGQGEKIICCYKECK